MLDVFALFRDAFYHQRKLRKVCEQSLALLLSTFIFCVRKTALMSADL